LAKPKTMCVLLKIVHKEKKNTKIQPKKIVCETVNFDSTKMN